MEPLTLFLIFSAIVMSIASVSASRFSIKRGRPTDAICYLGMGGCMLLLFYCVHQSVSVA